MACYLEAGNNYYESLDAMRKIVARHRRLPNRTGMVSLDYVMVLAVVFPFSVVLLILLVRGLIALYYFSSTTIGWIPF